MNKTDSNEPANAHKNWMNLKNEIPRNKGPIMINVSIGSFLDDPLIKIQLLRKAPKK